MKMAQERLIYLYCVTKTKPPRVELDGMKVKVYPIYSEGAYAIVSDVSPREFSEDNFKKNLADIKWIEKKARQHEKVIEGVMRGATVLPFKLGTIFETERNVERLLKEQNRKFKKILASLDGKEERGLKIYCDINRFKEAFSREDERIREINEQAAASGEGKAYILKKKKEELIDNILSEKISECTRDSFDRLRRLSADGKINKLLPEEVTQKKEKMVLNAAFLVEARRAGELDASLEYLMTKYGQKGLEFTWTGPWPPYNFCSSSKREGV